MKKVFYLIIGLLVLYFLLAFFGPKQVKAERSVVINAPAETVRQKLADFRYFHDRWSPWTEKDPGMKVTYSGQPGNPGHEYEWLGNKEVGSGKMKIVRMSGDSIVQLLSFEDQGDALAYFVVKQLGNQCHVVWGLQFDVAFGMRTPMLFMDMEGMIGEDYEKGLLRLKRAAENEEQSSAALVFTALPCGAATRMPLEARR